MTNGTPRCPPVVERLLVVLAAALFGIVLCELQRYLLPPPFSGRADFDQLWFASRALWQGYDPYALIGPGRTFHWPWRFYYPLTAAVMIGPLAALPLDVARVVFVGLSSGLLALAITKDGYDRLPIFLSGAFVLAARIGQWSPLLTAAICMPGLAWVFAAKPNLGLVFVAAAGRRRTALVALVGGLLLLGVSLWLAPLWIGQWLTLVKHSPVQEAPIRTTIGPVALLALLRWRRPEARLVAFMACVPFTFMTYELLPLLLVARTRLEMMVLALFSCMAVVLPFTVQDLMRSAASFSTTLILLHFVPPLILVLRRPNEGPAPAWMEPVLARLVPRWLAGSRPASPA